LGNRPTRGERSRRVWHQSRINRRDAGGTIRRVKRIAALVALVFLVSEEASGELRNMTTCLDVTHDCGLVGKQIDDPVEAMRMLACVQYLRGIFDGIIVSQMATEKLIGKKIMCSPPDGISGEQMANIVVKWVHDHPADQHQTPRLCATVAFREAFPCEGMR
jgi:hypothetical protein